MPALMTSDEVEANARLVAAAAQLVKVYDDQMVFIMSGKQYAAFEALREAVLVSKRVLKAQPCPH